jgi:hypothetical protein
MARRGPVQDRKGALTVRALVVQHDHTTEPGLVGARLMERGYDLTVVTVVPCTRVV